jgi:N-acetyl-gamma-glutamylphosphate reductase
MHRTPLDNASFSHPRIPSEWEPATLVSAGGCYPHPFLLRETCNLTPSATPIGVRAKTGVSTGGAPNGDRRLPSGTPAGVRRDGKPRGENLWSFSTFRVRLKADP